MPNLEASSSVPHEVIGSYCSLSATHLALYKKLISDINNIHKLTFVNMCSDTTNCYYFIAHPFVRMCGQYFGLKLCYLIVLFQSIQNIKIFLFTEFILSSTFYTRNNESYSKVKCKVIDPIQPYSLLFLSL